MTRIEELKTLNEKETELIESVRNGEYGVPYSEWTVDISTSDDENDWGFALETLAHFVIERDKFYIMRVNGGKVEYQNSRGNWKTARPGLH